MYRNTEEDKHRDKRLFWFFYKKNAQKKKKSWLNIQQGKYHFQIDIEKNSGEQGKPEDNVVVIAELKIGLGKSITARILSKFFSRCFQRLNGISTFLQFPKTEPSFLTAKHARKKNAEDTKKKMMIENEPTG